MIRFRLFGTLELRNGKGTDLHSVLAHSKHIGLLAYLLVGKHRLHRRERLTALLWPDLDDVRARNALSKALHHLRHALADDVFVTEGNEALGSNPDVLWCDVSAFEAASAAGKHEEALELYRRGELLDAFSLPDSPGFEQWLEQQRLRLQRQALHCAAALTDEAERASDYLAAAAWARVGCEISPYDEKTLQRYLMLLSRSGNRTAALSAYQDFAQRIARDLDTIPSDATRSIADSVRNGGQANSETVFPTVDKVPVSNHAPAPIASRFRVRRLIAAAALGAVAATGVWIYVSRSREQPGLVAVSLLRNRTGDTALSSFADVATGSIVQELTHSGHVDVVDLRGAGGPVSGRDSFNATGTSRSLARDLGAGKVVTGDIYSKGDSLLVQMQIVSASDGRVLHQLDPVATRLTNSYALLDRIREGVTGAVAALADTLYLPWSTAHSHPPNYAAFQEFMQGLDALVHTGATPAVAHLKRAVALDTGFVEAKIWLLEQASMFPEERAYVDSISAAAFAQRAGLGQFDQVSLDRELAFLAGRLETVYGAARRLVAIAPSTPDAQVYLAQASMATRRYPEAIAVLHGIDLTKGWLKDLPQLWDWDLQAHRLNGDAAGGLAEWRRLRARLPHDYDACSAGVPLFAALGREQEVDALVHECLVLPGAPPTMDRSFLIAGRVYRRAGFSDAAQRAFNRALTIRTEAAKVDSSRLRRVAFVQCELGHWRLAYDILRVSADTSNLDDHIALGVAAAHLGDTATVTKTFRWIDQWRHREAPHGQDKMGRAFIMLAGGAREEPLRLLRQAMDEGAAPAWNAWYVRFELQPLRGDPRFEEMIRPRV